MTTKNLIGNSDDRPEEVTDAARVLSTLDSVLRLKIVKLLQQHDHFVHELVKELGKSQPLISQHLKVLKMSGLVESERRGREVMYRLTTPAAGDLIDQAARLAAIVRGGTPQLGRQV